MAYFVEHGKFPAERIECAKGKRSLVVTILWNILLGVPLLWYILSVLLSGSITSLLIAAVIALVGFIVIKVLLHFSDSKKGSSFGLKPSHGTRSSTPPNGDTAKKLA